jgi:hypothetical protein
MLSFQSLIKAMSRKSSKRRHMAIRRDRPMLSDAVDAIDSRNNNQDVDSASDAPTDEDRNLNIVNPGIGDSTWNNDRLTNYTSNHSSDA